MNTLLSNLKTHDKGFLVDELTLNYYMVYDQMYPEISRKQPSPSNHHHHLLNEVIKTPLILGDEELSYGILVRDELVYNYFKKYAHDNWFQLDVCRRNYINYQMSKKNTLGEQDLPSVFSIEGGLFLPALYGCLVLLCVALLAGFAYECWKRKAGRDVGPCRIDQNDGNNNAGNC